jgi:hypothetical protein
MSDDAHPLAAGVLAALKDDTPTFIWACDDAKGECRVCFTSPSLNYSTPYVRRDPAVLAELPEVKAMIAAAVLEAAAEADSEGWPDAMSKQHYAALTERDEAEMDCGTRIADAIRALIKPDAKAALEAHVAAEVRGALEGVSRRVREIEEQLAANEGYFSGSDLVTLQLLQGHIKDSLAAIRALIPEVKP